MPANKYRGEVEAEIAGKKCIVRYTLDGIARVMDVIGDDGLDNIFLSLQRIYARSRMREMVQILAIGCPDIKAEEVLSMFPPPRPDAIFAPVVEAITRIYAPEDGEAKAEANGNPPRHAEESTTG